MGVLAFQGGGSAGMVASESSSGIAKTGEGWGGLGRKMREARQLLGSEAQEMPNKIQVLL